MNCRAVLFAATLLATVSSLYGQQPLEIKEAEVDVRVEFVESPRIGADNVSPISSSGLANPKWLEVSVVYSMPLRSDPKTKQMDWVDDMNVIVRLLLPAEYRGERVTAMLSGREVLMSVPCDGKKHRLALYVPHVVLSRYAAPDFKLNKSSAKELPVAVLFQTRQQQALGGGFFIPKNSNRTATLNSFKEADARLNILRVEDSILPREQTPWAHLDFDAFDMPKPVSGSK